MQLRKFFTVIKEFDVRYAVETTNLRISPMGWINFSNI